MLHQTVFSPKNIKRIIKTVAVRGIKIYDCYEMNIYQREKVKMSYEFTDQLLEFGRQ